jgi:hypothetical protein
MGLCAGRNTPRRIHTQLLTMKLPLPIICPPRRYVRWDRIAIIVLAIAWWVGLIWCHLQYKGGAA